jgi:hypothetical protein
VISDAAPTIAVTIPPAKPAAVSNAAVVKSNRL